MQYGWAQNFQTHIFAVRWLGPGIFWLQKLFRLQLIYQSLYMQLTLTIYVYFVCGYGEKGPCVGCKDLNKFSNLTDQKWEPIQAPELAPSPRDQRQTANWTILNP